MEETAHTELPSIWLCVSDYNGLSIRSCGKYNTQRNIVWKTNIGLRESIKVNLD